MIHLLSAAMQGKHFPKRNVGWSQKYVIIQMLKCFRCLKVLLGLVLGIEAPMKSFRIMHITKLLSCQEIFRVQV